MTQGPADRHPAGAGPSGSSGQYADRATRALELTAVATVTALAVVVSPAVEAAVLLSWAAWWPLLAAAAWVWWDRHTPCRGGRHARDIEQGVQPATRAGAPGRRASGAAVLRCRRRGQRDADGCIPRAPQEARLLPSGAARGVPPHPYRGVRREPLLQATDSSSDLAPTQHWSSFSHSHWARLLPKELRDPPASTFVCDCHRRSSSRGQNGGPHARADRRPA